MVADPITTWLGTPDSGEPPQDESTPKAMSSTEVKADEIPIYLCVGDHVEHNVGTVARPDDADELPHRVAALLREVADEVERGGLARAMPPL